jgi:hypothetical protein
MTGAFASKPSLSASAGAFERRTEDAVEHGELAASRY